MKRVVWILCQQNILAFLPPIGAVALQLAAVIDFRDRYAKVFSLLAAAIDIEGADVRAGATGRSQPVASHFLF